MLDAAGSVLGGDGVRAKGSLRLAFDLVTPTGSPAADQRATIIASDWKKIGVAPSVRRYTRTMLYDAYSPNVILERGKFDIEQSHEGYGIFCDLSLIFGCSRCPARCRHVALLQPGVRASQTTLTTSYEPGPSQSAAA